MQSMSWGTCTNQCKSLAPPYRHIWHYISQVLQGLAAFSIQCEKSAGWGSSCSEQPYLFQTGIIASIISPSYCFTSSKLLYSTSMALHGLTFMLDKLLPMGQFPDEDRLSLP